MTGMFSRFKKDPFAFLCRAFNKLVVAPFKYRVKGNYDAERYWKDRFSRYGLSLKGVGDEGLSDAENDTMYQEAGRSFLSLCRQRRVDFPTARILEIGCGNGFYANLLAEQGVRHYVGIDITDVFFSELRKRHPSFQFSRMDITSDGLHGEFDLILMIDVIEHITSDTGLQAAFDNVKNCLAQDGIFLVAPVPEKGKRSLFYVRFWSLSEIMRHFRDFDVVASVPFRYNRMLAIRKP